MEYCPPKSRAASEKSMRRTGGWGCHVDIEERKDKGRTDSTEAPKKGVTGIFKETARKPPSFKQSKLVREYKKRNRIQVLGLACFQRSTRRCSWWFQRNIDSSNTSGNCRCWVKWLRGGPVGHLSRQIEWQWTQKDHCFSASRMSLTLAVEKKTSWQVWFGDLFVFLL